VSKPLPVKDQMWSKLLSHSGQKPIWQKKISHSGYPIKSDLKKFAPRWRTLSHSGLWPDMVTKKFAPHRRTMSHSGLLTKCGPMIAPRRRTLSRSGLLTKCGPMIAPRRRTLSRSGLLTKCDPINAPRWRTLSRSKLKQTGTIVISTPHGNLYPRMDFRSDYSHRHAAITEELSKNYRSPLRIILSSVVMSNRPLNEIEPWNK